MKYSYIESEQSQIVYNVILIIFVNTNDSFNIYIEIEQIIYQTIYDTNEQNALHSDYIYVK